MAGAGSATPCVTDGGPAMSTEREMPKLYWSPTLGLIESRSSVWWTVKLVLRTDAQTVHEVKPADAVPLRLVANTSAAREAYNAACGPVEYQIFGTWLSEKVNGCTCAPEPTLGQHEPHCGWESVVDLSTLPGWPTVPQDDETVHRVADAIRLAGLAELGMSSDDLDAGPEDFYPEARAALRALGEVSHG